MKIVIVGDGKIGSTLAEQLCREGHEITIIDRSGEPLQQTSEDLDILCIEGNGATYSTQMEAGVNRADLLIAVTDSDELNLLCCLVAKKLGAGHTIARVRNPEYSEELSLISDDLGLSLTVNPDLNCASEIARTLRTPSAIKTDTFSGGRVDLLTFQLPEDSLLVGKTLMDLPGLIRAKVLICAVERDNEVTIPSGTFRLQAGDRISFVAFYKAAQAFFRQLKLSTRAARSVILVGGGRIGYYLAKQLLESGISVKIIDSDYERCEELSGLLPGATILHGDGTSEAFLLESGIADTDAFCALTGLDEENILMGLYVRRTWPNVKVVTKTNRFSFHDIIDSMDLGSMFNPRSSAADLICRYVRCMQTPDGSKVETLYRLVDGRVEALEFRVAANSAVCGIPLQKLQLRKNLLIACINRAGQIRIPTGQDTIEAGDAVIVVTSIPGLKELDDILADSKGANV